MSGVALPPVRKSCESARWQRRAASCSRTRTLVVPTAMVAAAIGTGMVQGVWPLLASSGVALGVNVVRRRVIDLDGAEGVESRRAG